MSTRSMVHFFVHCRLPHLNATVYYPYLSSCMLHWYVQWCKSNTSFCHMEESHFAASIQVISIYCPSLKISCSWVESLQGQFESRVHSYVYCGTYPTLDPQCQQQQEHDDTVKSPTEHAQVVADDVNGCWVIGGVTAVPVDSIVIFGIPLLAVLCVDYSPLPLTLYMPPDCVRCAAPNSIWVQEADLLLVPPSRALNAVRL